MLKVLLVSAMIHFVLKFWLWSLVLNDAKQAAPACTGPSECQEALDV